MSLYSACPEPYLDPAVLENIRTQLAMLLSQSEQTVSSEAALSQRVTSLAMQVEALRKEIVKVSSRVTLTEKCTFTSEPNIAVSESRATPRGSTTDVSNVRQD